MGHSSSSGGMSVYSLIIVQGKTVISNVRSIDRHVSIVLTLFCIPTMSSAKSPESFTFTVGKLGS